MFLYIIIKLNATEKQFESFQLLFFCWCVTKLSKGSSYKFEGLVLIMDGYFDFRFYWFTKSFTKL